jgi:16S rRNA processing protein RimM
MAEEHIAPGIVVMGRITGIFGVRGWVRVFSHTVPRSNILDYPRWLLGRAGSWEGHKLSEGRVHGKAILAKLEDCSDRDQAAGLMGYDIGVPRAEMPDLPPDEFYWADLQGLRVQTLDGIELGRIASLVATGANDVMVVQGERERLIPFLWASVVREVDLRAGLVVVDWDQDF